MRMLVGTKFAPAMLALAGPLSMEEFAAVTGAAVVLPALVVWLVMRSKSKRQQAESATALEKQRADAEATLKAEQARAATAAAEAKKAADAVAAKLTDTEQRFSTHREVSERRANDASQQIARLESELATTREVAAQLVPTQSRIKDLELALSAEQGRVKAQEQAIEATNARAADFEKRLIEAQELVMRHKEEMRDNAVELKKVRDEQAAYAAAGGPEAELAKAREAHQQAEVKIANLQRALKAAEARIEMVQKEFMNAVGVASAPVAGAPAAAPSSDKKVRDLEEKLAHLEAESRKRAREDGYKIAELEYRLSEAIEGGKNSQAKAEAPAKSEPPPPTAPSPVVEPVKVEPQPVVEAPVSKEVDPQAVEPPVAAAPVTATVQSELPLPSPTPAA